MDPQMHGKMIWRRMLHGILLLPIATSTWGVAMPVWAEDAADYGFLPTADATQNVAALQKALDGGNKTLTVSRPGVYLLNHTLYIDNDTDVRFGSGVILKKTGDGYSNIFINRGAATREWNHNISIDGLRISVNNVEGKWRDEDPLFGARGQVMMMFIRNFTLTNFKCLDLGHYQYAVQACKFENIKIEGFEIRGDKDGIHLGAGKQFVIRDGIIETFDDGVPLNAHDWPSSQPLLGDIVDGLVENVYDMPRQKKPSGYFARLLTSAWGEWHDGIRLQRGDTVLNGTNVYRVMMPLGTNEYVSHEAPVHTAGAWEDSTGLRFVWCQNDGARSANIRNVTFSNIVLSGSRSSGFSCDPWGASEYCRAIHPQVPKKDFPVCEVTFVNIHCIAPANNLIACHEQGRFILDKITQPPGGRIIGFTGKDVVCSLLVTGSTFTKTDKKGPGDIHVGPAVTLNMVLESAMQERDIELRVSPQSRTRVNGTASIDSLDSLTPVAGDSIKVKNVRKTFNGAKWE